MNIVIVGAGGTGISNIAHILRDLGYKNLVAIDAVKSQITESLEKRGIPMIIGHGKYSVKAEDIVIYSSATEQSPELQQAFQLAKAQHTPARIWNYFEFLGEVSKYFRTIGFAGTNGKSSTTALAIYAGKQLLPELGLGILGALVPDFEEKSYYLNPKKYSEIQQIFNAILTGKNIPYTLIKKYYFFVEACEYQRHFLDLDCEKLIITNIELEHTDYFKDREDYLGAFIQLIDKTQQEVFVLEKIGVLDGENLVKIKKIAEEKYVLKHIWGEYLSQNLSLVKALFKKLLPQLEREQLIATMQDFRGIWRRMEYLGKWKTGTKIYSDYGHMASSLLGGYTMLKEKYPDQEILAVFQPHQLQRMVVGRDDFHKALSCFDGLAIYDIYAAREFIEKFQDYPMIKKNQLSSIHQIGEFFAKENGAKYYKNFQELSTWLDTRNKNQIVVFFSAGDLDYHMRNAL